MKYFLLFLIGTLSLTGCESINSFVGPTPKQKPKLFNPLAVRNDTSPKTPKTSSDDSGNHAEIQDTQEKPLSTQASDKSYIFEVTSPSWSFDADNTTYKLVVKDDSCKGANYPDLIGNIDTSTLALGTGIEKKEIQYIYTLKLPKDTDKNSQKILNLTVRSCASTAISDEKAKEKNLIRTIQLTATKQPYTASNATLNVWSDEDTENEFGKLFATYFYAADAVFVNKNSTPVLVYGSSLTAKVRFRVSEEDLVKAYCNGDTTNQTNQTSCLKKIAQDKTSDLYNRFDWKEDFRPMSFSDVLAIFVYNQEADPRKRQVEGFKSLGKLLAGAAVFTSAKDYAKGVSFLTGIVLPEYEKLQLWDLLLHIKNLEARSLKEVEEIPSNGQVRKVVFFPRRPITGILPELPVYIAEIRPDAAKVDQTIITKEATLSSSDK